MTYKGIRLQNGLAVDEDQRIMCHERDQVHVRSCTKSKTTPTARNREGPTLKEFRPYFKPWPGEYSERICTC